jgi:hypothetical protein
MSALIKRDRREYYFRSQHIEIAVVKTPPYTWNIVPVLHHGDPVGLGEEDDPLLLYLCFCFFNVGSASLPVVMPPQQTHLSE